MGHQLDWVLVLELQAQGCNVGDGGRVLQNFGDLYELLNIFFWMHSHSEATQVADTQMWNNDTMVK